MKGFFFLVATRSFTAMMPSGWVFILFCILLRMTEGVGSAMLSTAAFSLLPELFPNHLATVMVLVPPNLAQWLSPPPVSP